TGWSAARSAIPGCIITSGRFLMVRSAARASRTMRPHPSRRRFAAPQDEEQTPGPLFLLALRPHDGPADARQRLAALHETLEHARHFGNETGEALTQMFGRRPRGVLRVPHHDAAPLEEALLRHPRRAARRRIEQQMGPAGSSKRD